MSIEFSSLPDNVRSAALRFHETTSDDGTYDIDSSLRSELTNAGLIRHRGGGVYVETSRMLDFLEWAEG